jgi:hypothetical protein
MFYANLNCLYQKDERAEPGDLSSRKFKCLPPPGKMLSSLLPHFLFSFFLMEAIMKMAVFYVIAPYKFTNIS